ncbi:MAG: Uma2 family endonuclease [Microcoleus sp. PH2017_10_PVI_O_A]|uniref:Uma2 family endonuclease n=1 Tax=unclassified Microcoleus TaxID=2642155 RepID=UPI001D467728|nr:MULTISPECIES: Uma2 family endonuclease [unclassified Microcoleus]TAE76221.1 MAG: Uma2 family endonuclease [Oscillatoriales cyanobacterium]MCC3408302.1 Uma2 family endonuclease [Microcoleus sp. PH2017_10_PVI_O_A]MCC3461626.1 Uma2 family endonuclease [Microcoleus sp. PH2017_11_PCY_U_A]MCC3480863.1 Uma2 family endonuclease [Microcoleus sp. PH2017_12_PCY_D_A]MCC3530770.1 Uma2 family endonuclease [Microcoleus sp. PH2017_21_RUC_O_A]
MPLLSKTTDRRIIHHGMWERFKFIEKGFEGSAGVRLFYYNGTIEILMPGEDRETFARVIGYLITTFLVEQGIFFKPTGAMTQERSGVVSVQADESYCIGSVKPIPDLSIEVVFTSGGISKLDRYQALGVPEVWFWEDGLLKIYHLQNGSYQRIDRSQLPGLSNLNLDLMKRCILMAETDAGEAIRAFRREM